MKIYAVSYTLKLGFFQQKIKFFIMSKIYPRFCLVQNFGAPIPATWASIQELMRSTQVNNLCAQIAALDPSAEDYDKRKSALKKQLPAITVHAQQFFDQKRSNDSAVWNGLVCLEYDHLTPDEINAIRLTEPPIPGIILCGRSCSGAGVWLLIEVPNNDHKLIESTLNAVHEEYCQRIRNKTGLDISQKVDIQLDLARMRFLPRYDYIFWNNVKDFDNETQAEEPYYNMYADVIDLCDTFETQIPIGKRNTTYKEYMLQVAQKTNNTALMLRHIPDLGLSE